MHDRQGYSHVADGSLMDWVSKSGTLVDGVSVGRVGVFWLDPGSRIPQHVAVFTSRGMVHCYDHIGKVVEHGYVSYWKARLISIFRCNGLED